MRKQIHDILNRQNQAMRISHQLRIYSIKKSVERLKNMKHNRGSGPIFPTIPKKSQKISCDSPFKASRESQVGSTYWLRNGYIYEKQPCEFDPPKINEKKS
jgi:hypothetical protein